jgi:hypothetical protein
MSNIDFHNDQCQKSFDKDMSQEWRNNAVEYNCVVMKEERQPKI